MRPIRTEVEETLINTKLKREYKTTNTNEISNGRN